MTAAGLEKGWVALNVEGLLLTKLGSDGFEGDTEIDVLTIGDATLDAAAVVGLHADTTEGAVISALDRGEIEEVVLLGATHGETIEALTVFEALDGIDREHGGAEELMELAELWGAETDRTALDDTGDGASDGIAVFLDFLDERLHLCCLGLIWTTDRVGLYLREVVFAVVEVEGDRTYL